MITELTAQPKAALLARQRALNAAVARIKAQAESERRALNQDEITEIEALRALLAALTRDLNRANDVTPVGPADPSEHRGHMLARGPPPDKILRWKEVTAITSVSRPTAWRMTKRGQFPQSIPITPDGRSRGWLLSEINTWVAERAASRPAAARRAQARPAEAASSN